MAGVPTTAHSKILADNLARTDAVSAQRLHAAGGVLVGKLATHEFAMGGPSFDLPWPPARNAWNRDHFSGGSSSGSERGRGGGLCARRPWHGHRRVGPQPGLDVALLA